MRRLAMLSILLVACSTVQEFETELDEQPPPAAPGTTVMPSCDPGQCAPIVLADEQGLDPDRADMQGVWTVVADDTWVYWMTAWSEIYRLPKDGGEAPELLAETRSAPSMLKLAGDYLYFTNVPEGRVERIPKRGGDVEAVTPAVADPGGGMLQVMAFTVDESAITWMDTRRVQRCESIPCRIPGGARQLRAGADDDRPAAVATAGERVFVSLWVEGGSPARGIAAVDQGGYVATLDVPYWFLLARPAAEGFTTIYGASDDVLVRAAFPGAGPARVLASGPDLDGVAMSLTLDGGFLYWVNTRQGGIMRVREDGTGKPESVIDGQGWLRSVFLTSDAIYFGGNEGKVLKMPKPKDTPTR